MSPHAHYHGHHIDYTDVTGWLYQDGTPVEDDPERPCPRCGEPRTPEGHDACLGKLPFVESACCGHGAEEPYVVMMGGFSYYGDEALTVVEELKRMGVA